jgi:hypothetical protein
MMKGKGYVSPYAMAGYGKGAYGGAFSAFGGKKGGGGGKASWGEGANAPVPRAKLSWRQGGAPPDPKNAWGGEIEGFREALTEAFEQAGVEDEFDEIYAKIKAVADKQAKKWYNDERSGTKMSSPHCRAFLGEFIEAVMGALATFLYDKPWFEKVSWNGAILMLVIYSFEKCTVFTRVCKTDVIQLIDDGLLAWSEEERVTRAMWSAIENAGIKDSQRKKVNQHLMKAYDDAHFNSPFWSQQHENLGPETAAVHDFLKGFMLIFYGKAYGALENGLVDTSQPGVAQCLTALFTGLMNPENPVLPISLQPALPAAPWHYIEECANEVLEECSQEGQGKKVKLGM